MDFIDKLRIESTQKLDQSKRSQLGQYMTPSAIADFMASLFTVKQKEVRLLDAGAGIGSLTAAFIQKNNTSNIQAELWEIDQVLISYLEKNLENEEAVIRSSDFIEDAVKSLLNNTGSRFTHCIINPPYKKINSNSTHRELLRQVGVETVNLYSAFLALCILLLQENGQVVAIIPRSFCNGVYYKPFRKFLLDKCSIEHIHLFESRKKAFKDDDVLQENIIIKLVKTKQVKQVRISTSHDGSFGNYEVRLVSLDEIIKPEDDEVFIHVPTQTEETSIHFKNRLQETGLKVSTGPVVDFRVKEFCTRQPERNSVPLLYPHHFKSTRLDYPREHKKPNGILVNEETKKWLMPKGFYTIVKRFSSKEEKKRIVAYVVSPKELNFPYFGFENHFNVFHENKQGLDEETAYGLSAYLNSTLIDNYFRVFSGHTQVNVADLKLLKYPSRSKLRRIGKLTKSKQLNQEQIDHLFLKEIVS